MNSKKFFVTEYSGKITALADKTIQIYSANGFEREASNLSNLLSKISKEKQIRMVFIGQYTAGKSTIISALTGDSNIKIDSDIATDRTADYEWKGGVVLTDTPGLYTENTNHDRITIEMIRESDLLVYCITSDLFNQYTKADFEKWAFEMGYSGKMFLVINKMSKEAGEFSELAVNYANSIDSAISPHTLQEVPYCFVDAKDYKDGISLSNPALIQYSHFEDFIEQLNQFVIEKGELGKLDTPIQIIKTSIDGVLYEKIDDDQHRSYINLLSRIEKKVDQNRSQINAAIRACLQREIRPIIEKGYEISRSVGFEEVFYSEEDLKELITSCCESINKQLEMVITKSMDELSEEIEEVLKSDTATYFFNSVSGDINKKVTLFESKQAKINRAQYNAINSVVEGITGKTLQLATNSTAVAGKFFISASDAAGSSLHTFVKAVGGKIGVKFKPWQAVNIAKSVGNAAKVIGTAFSVISVFLDAKEIIDEANQDEEIRKAQIECRQNFKEIAEDLNKQYINELSGLFNRYNDITRTISEQRSGVEQLVKNNDLMTKQLTGVKAELSEIQNAIF